MSVEPLAFVGGVWDEIEEDSDLPTILGGQGFTMMVVGARAQNIDTCGVMLHATLRHAENDAVLYDAEQEINLSTVDETTAESADDEGLQGVQLIPCGGGIETGCPVPVRLEVTLTDRLGHTATASRSGTFSCGPRYGECTTDGGIDAGP